MQLMQLAPYFCLLYTSDAADERSSVDLGGRRIIKKKHKNTHNTTQHLEHHTLTRQNRTDDEVQPTSSSQSAELKNE